VIFASFWIILKQKSLFNFALDENATRSTTQMLRDRVTKLDLHDVDLKYEVLTDYDGNGMCQYIRVLDFGNYRPEIYREKVKYFETWVRNKSMWIMKDFEKELDIFENFHPN